MSDLDIEEIRGTRHVVFTGSEPARSVNGTFLLADLGDRRRYRFEAVVRDPDIAAINTLFNDRNGGIIPQTLTYTYDGDSVERTAYFVSRPKVKTEDGSKIVLVELEEAD